MKSRQVIRAVLFFCAIVSSSTAQTLRVDTTPARVIKFDPDQALGSSMDILFSEQTAQNPAYALRRRRDGAANRLADIGNKDRISSRPLDQKWQLAFGASERAQVRKPAQQTAAVVQLGQHLEVECIVGADGARAGDGAESWHYQVEVVGADAIRRNAQIRAECLDVSLIAAMHTS